MNPRKLRFTSLAMVVFLFSAWIVPGLRGVESGPVAKAGEPAVTSPVKTSVENMDALQVLTRKVDALEIEAAKENRPWYRDMSTMIAVLSFIFAFGTTWISARKAKTQEIEAHRAELRSLLQRMAALPKENLEAMEKYRDNPAALSTVSGYINQENTFLANQAAEIAKALPKGKISAVEYYGVAVALGNAYDLDGQKNFLALTIETAKDFNTKIAGLRTNAYAQFITGKPDSGRVEYQKAMAIFEEFPGYDGFTRASTHIKTEINWAYSENLVRLGNPLSEQHLAQAEELLVPLPVSPGRTQLEADIRQARQQLGLWGAGRKV